MKFKPHFSNALNQHHAENSEEWSQQLEVRYLLIKPDIAFAKTSKNPMDKRLELIGYFLAFIQVLETHEQSYEQIREICLEVAYEVVKPKSKLAAWAKKLPIKFVDYAWAQKLLQKLNTKLNRRGHEHGFVAEIITDKKLTLGTGYGVNILECGVCKLFNKHKAANYTSILCDVDKITTEFAGLEMVISGTISRGAPICDFRYKVNGTN